MRLESTRFEFYSLRLDVFCAVIPLPWRHELVMITNTGAAGWHKMQHQRLWHQESGWLEEWHGYGQKRQCSLRRSASGLSERPDAEDQMDELDVGISPQNDWSTGTTDYDVPNSLEHRVLGPAAFGWRNQQPAPHPSTPDRGRGLDQYDLALLAGDADRVSTVALVALDHSGVIECGEKLVLQLVEAGSITLESLRQTKPVIFPWGLDIDFVVRHSNHFPQGRIRSSTPSTTLWSPPLSHPTTSLPSGVPQHRRRR